MFVNTEKIHTISFFKIRGKWIENIKTQIIVIPPFIKLLINPK